MDTSLSTIDTAHPQTWKITDLCTTALSQRHRIYTLHWSDIHYFLLLHPTDKQKWWGTYCWLAPCAIECLHLFSRLSALHLPQLSALWRRARNYRGRRAVQLHGQQSTDAQLSCPGTTKDQLLAPWQLKLFWEPRIRTAHEFTRHKSSNQRNLGKRSFVSVVVSGQKTTIRHCASHGAACTLCLKCTAKTAKLEVFLSCLPCESTLNKIKQDGSPQQNSLIWNYSDWFIWSIFKKSPAAYFPNHSSMLNVNSLDKPFKSLGERIVLIKLRTFSFGSIISFLAKQNPWKVKVGTMRRGHKITF